MRERIEHEVAAVVLKEFALRDAGMLGGTQAALEYDVIDEFPVNDQEILVRHLHKGRRRLGGTLPTRAEPGRNLIMTTNPCPARSPSSRRFTETWCLPTETERWNQRLASTMPQLRDFYEAFFPRVEEAIDYCDKFALDDLPDDALNLLHLIYSLIMVAMAVEIMHQPAPVDAADAVMIRTGDPRP